MKTSTVTILTAVILSAVSHVRAQDTYTDAEIINQDSQSKVDLYFSNDAVPPTPTMPSEVDYWVHDRDSGRLLVDKTTVSSPVSQACDNGEPGCLTVQLNPEDNPFVGRCSNDSTRDCLANGDCISGLLFTAVCKQSTTEELQIHILTCEYRWSADPNDRATCRKELPIRNLKFFPQPPTPTPTS